MSQSCWLLALVLRSRGQHEEARKALQSVMRMATEEFDPDCRATLFYLALLELELAREAIARGELDEYLRLTEFARDRATQGAARARRRFFTSSMPEGH
ncbi:MAG: hypothetical protein CME06_10800 [Gemmatimonadetes bacterium]|nr:hypothetical protein [Gemmatimonadota bacterium]